MSNAKAMVTKEVAGALAIHAKSEVSVRTMLRHNVHGDLYGVYAPLQTMHVEELAKALLIGYEVEKSPEELLRNHYLEYRADNKFFADEYDRGYHGGYLSGIEDTLKILGITIERVTDQ